MFCFQCQETMSGKGCTRGGICQKKPELAALQDLLIWTSKGLSAILTQLRKEKEEGSAEADRQITRNLCLTMTNACFDPSCIEEAITETLQLCRMHRPRVEKQTVLPAASGWEGTPDAYAGQAEKITLSPESSRHDLTSFREMLTYALKGIASFLYMAEELGEEDPDIPIFIQRALAQTLETDLTGGNLLALSMEAGRYTIRAMDLLNRAKIKRFGEPLRTKVRVGGAPERGILVSGNDFSVLEEVLEQTAESGLAVYTHGELLAAHAYPAFAAYPHFKGQYGSSWVNQKEEFAAFHGPVLVTGEGIVPPKSSYRDRLFTTGYAAIPEARRISETDGKRDYAPLIACAREAELPEACEESMVEIGFGYATLFRETGTIAEAIRNGTVKKIAIVAGDDGRVKKRQYYTDLRKALPEDVLLFSAGSISFRFPEEEAKEGTWPAVCRSGELGDAYSLIQFALRLREELGYDNLNQLPLFFSVAWHGQRSLAVLLALLYLDIKHIFLGPTAPAFFSDGVSGVLTNYFGLRLITTVHEDLEAVLGKPDDLITPDMIVNDIVREYPSLVPVMNGVGLHCIGCGVSEMENLAEACMTHGLDVYDVLELLNDHLRKTV